MLVDTTPLVKQVSRYLTPAGRRLVKVYDLERNRHKMAILPEAKEQAFYSLINPWVRSQRKWPYYAAINETVFIFDRSIDKNFKHKNWFKIDGHDFAEIGNRRTLIKMRRMTIGMMALSYEDLYTMDEPDLPCHIYFELEADAVVARQGNKG